MKKVLFICKKNYNYGFVSHTRRSSGLFNSTKFVADALNNHGIEADVVEVVDNNCIDREVTLYKPTDVVIEALWVVPEKFRILKKLHPHVKWHVHIHSNIPFIANEGSAMEWILEYLKHGVKVIANCKKAYDGLYSLIGSDNLLYLPNVYPSKFTAPKWKHRDHIHVACFGAIRPMKNQLIQAIAAIEFAKDMGKPLHFHINGTRVENSGGGSVLKNLKALFEKTPNVKLVEHNWHEHDQFIETLKHMDIGLQVSLSETFNIVTADMVSAGLPVVTSDMIDWVSNDCHADTSDVLDIKAVMNDMWHNGIMVRLNQLYLAFNSKKATRLWVKHFHH